MSIARQKIEGNDHPVAVARCRWSEIEGWARYLRPLIKKECTMPAVNVCAQANGRWSTTKDTLTGDGVPLVNFPPEVRDGTSAQEGKYIKSVWSTGIILPDPGYYWVKYDLDAVEGKLEAIISHDEQELERHERREDLHTLTACTLFGLPVPPILTKHVHDSPVAQAWRDSVQWAGEGDYRRHVAKTTRYNLVYALDERGILQSVAKLAMVGVGRREAMRFAKLYLESRPLLVQTKRRIGMECARTGLARTAFGRPRQLYGPERTRRKEGWSHTLSGTVSDMGNLSAIQIQDRFPESYIVLNAHDSQVWAFPSWVRQAVEGMKEIVEQTWTVWNKAYRFPATWHTYASNGTRRKI